MSARVDPDLLPNLEKFGVTDAATCFNCGNCTAVCSLSSASTPFPRKVIRYLQLGLKEKLVKRPEPWLCYYCGDCSDTCPRQADPAEVMMGLRRYLTSDYEPTGISRLFYRNNVFASLSTLFLAFLLGYLLVLTGPAHTGNASPVSRWLFQLVDYHFVEYLGMAVFAVVALSMVGGVVNIVRRFLPAGHFAKTPDSPKEGGLTDAVIKTLKEILVFQRYRDCGQEDPRPLLLKPWFIHGAIMWGFFGLALATVLDMPQLGLKDPNTTTWLPSRGLGIVAGLFLMYGTTVALMNRIRKTGKNAETSRFSDWLFLVFLWGLGVTGFWLTASVYIAQPHPVHQIVLLIHTVMAMELLLLFAFSKFAHVAYRPIALFFYFLTEDNL